MPGEWDEGVTHVRAPSYVEATQILVADADPRRRAWLREIIAGHFAVEEVDTGRVALERLSKAPPRVIIVGPFLTDCAGAALLEHAASHGLLSPQAGGPVVFSMSDGTDAGPPLDEQKVPIFYRLTPQLPATRVRELIAQAIARLPHARTKAPTEADALRTRQVLEHAKRLGAQPDLAAAAAAAIAAVVELLEADRARCLYYDDESGSLWVEGSEEPDEHAASAGISGFVVRTTAAIVLPRASDDNVYLAAVDDPAGTGAERLAVQPVAGRDGHVHAVLIAVRSPNRPPFSEEDARKLGALADAWAPFIHQLAQAREAEAVLEPQASDDDGQGEMYRQEAIVHFVRQGQRGDVVRVHPAWVHAAYWMVVASIAAIIGFAAVVEVHQYAEGPAVVRVTGRSDVTAYEGGTITSLEVAMNQEVAEGQVLARLHDTEQAARLRARATEFDRKLVAYLQTPTDPAVRQALAALVAERDSAEASVEARVIRAPRAGIVKNILVHNGQRVEAGKTIVSLVEKGGDEGLSVLAFLPGRERPRLRGNQRLRLMLPGYRNAQIDVEVRAVSGDVLGPNDARERYLGERLGDSVPLQGPVVVVEARLTSPTFQADGQTYELHDGMVGVAEVRLESQTILESLLPGQ